LDLLLDLIAGVGTRRSADRRGDVAIADVLAYGAADDSTRDSARDAVLVARLIGHTRRRGFGRPGDMNSRNRPSFVRTQQLSAREDATCRGYGNSE